MWCQYGIQSVWETDLFLMEKDVRGAVSYGYVSCTTGFFFFLVDVASFLIHSNHVYKHISRALWWHNFWTKEELCYSYRLHQLRRERWQFTGSQKCVIRFWTEIGQADDFNSLHDREREESTKSLSLPVTVCYVNSCNISDLCSFNLIISARLCFGA